MRQRRDPIKRIERRHRNDPIRGSLLVMPSEQVALVGRRGVDGGHASETQLPFNHETTPPKSHKKTVYGSSGSLPKTQLLSLRQIKAIHCILREIPSSGIVPIAVSLEDQLGESVPLAKR